MLAISIKSEDQLKKVLLIEDDKTMQSLIKTLLEIEGFFPLLPAEIQLDHILEDINTNHPDAIIMDVNLRQVSGLDILTKIRNSADINKTKIIMSSGLDLSGDCLKAGADGFLQKPYMPNQLISWLKANIE
jgi:DNA-binding response OmpR family regulator